jgi:surfeit locus 1 family protein
VRRLLWPALSTLAMLAITLSLGVWQVERLHWKLGLLADIDRAEASSPVPLRAAPAPFEPAPFEKVEVSGRMRDDLAVRYGSEVRTTLSGPTLGAQLVTPLERDGADPVLVDRGWMRDGAPPPQDPGEVRVVGYVHPADHASWFTPKDDPAARRFWTLDPAAIGAALGLPRVAPFILVALGPGDGPGPQPAHALPRPPNDHLGYAITWFGLAACLVGVFAAYARKTLRQ